jgi:hypothetical protein
MIGGLFFVPMLCLLGILIAWYRRDPRRFLDGPAEDMPLRLTRWAAGLLAPQRAEWGQAMLGELGHIEGRVRRMRMDRRCRGRLPCPPHARTDLRVLRGRRTLRIAVLCVILAAILFLAVVSWLSGR